MKMVFEEIRKYERVKNSQSGLRLGEKRKIANRLGEQGKTDRPICPECSSNEIISKGTSWYCKACGRWFLKKKRGQYYKRIKQELGAFLTEFWNKMRQKYPSCVLGDVLYYPKLAEAIGKKYGISDLDRTRTLMSNAVFYYTNQNKTVETPKLHEFFENIGNETQESWFHRWWAR